MKFKVGDKVLRNPKHPNTKLVTNTYLVVKSVEGKNISVEGSISLWHADKFFPYKGKSVPLNTDKEWTYNVQAIRAIDWKTTLSDLTLQQPIQLIEIQLSETGIKTQFVGMHHTLLNKARYLGIKLPGKPLKGHTNLFGCKNHFDEWVSWDKEVKSACWGKKRN